VISWDLAQVALSGRTVEGFGLSRTMQGLPLRMAVTPTPMMKASMQGAGTTNSGIVLIISVSRSIVMRKSDVTMINDG
jgi:hypothetical protein